MKKYLCAIMCLVLCISLFCGCSDNQEKAVSTQEIQGYWVLAKEDGTCEWLWIGEKRIKIGGYPSMNTNYSDISDLIIMDETFEMTVNFSNGDGENTFGEITDFKPYLNDNEIGVERKVKIKLDDFERKLKVSWYESGSVHTYDYAGEYYKDFTEKCEEKSSEISTKSISQNAASPNGKKTITLFNKTLTQYKNETGCRFQSNWESMAVNTYKLTNFGDTQFYLCVDDKELLGVQNDKIVFFGVNALYLGTDTTVRQCLPTDMRNIEPKVYALGGEQGQATLDAYVWEANNGYYVITAIHLGTVGYLDRIARQVMYVSDLSWLSFIQ